MNNHMDFNRSPRSQLRSSEAEFRATKHAPTKFEHHVKKAESWFDKFLDTPIGVAAPMIISTIAVLWAIIGYLGK